MIKIAVIEDDSSIVSQILNYYHNSTDVNCILSANSVESFVLELTKSTKPDILLLDIHLPGQSGLDALPDLKQLLPKTDIIMFTMDEERHSLVKAFSRGASGYIFKTTPIKDLLDYFIVIQKGGSIISSALAQTLFDYFKTNSNLLSILNKKEYQVLNLLAEGWSYKLIAERTGLSIDGVRFYIKRLYKALDVNSKGEAIHRFYRG
jgi:DNA-binding NarL/FixJ family response regulator